MADEGLRPPIQPQPKAETPPKRFNLSGLLNLIRGTNPSGEQHSQPVVEQPTPIVPPVDRTLHVESERPAVPLSRRMAMEPLEERGVPRSQVYTEQKLRGDYALYCEGREGYDPNKPVQEIQRDLFALWESGEVPFMQAMEWSLARKHDEWGPKEITRAKWAIDASKQDPRLPQVTNDDIRSVELAQMERQLRKIQRGDF